MAELITLDQLPNLLVKNEQKEPLRLLITGPRCSGKTRTAHDIAEKLQTLFVSTNAHGQISGLSDTVAEEIALGYEHLAETRQELYSRVKAVSQELGIEHLSTQNPLQLSGGQTQLVVIAAHSIIPASGLVLDEPFAGLDHSAHAQVLKVFEKYPGHIIWTSSRPTLDEIGQASHILELQGQEAVAPLQPATAEEKYGLQQILTPRTLTVTELAADARAQRRRPHLPLRRSRNIAQDATVSGINLVLEPGDILMLTGPNGSGKTTLLRTLAGLNQAVSGNVTIAGQEPHKLSTPKRLKYVSLASQNPSHHFLTPTVDAELRIGGASRAPDTYRNHLLTLFGLADQRQSHPQDLSPVQQHLLAIATALATGASYTLLDEPTARLDQTGVNQLITALTEYTQTGGSLIIASHDNELMARLPHHRYRLEKPDITPRQ